MAIVSSRRSFLKSVACFALLPGACGGSVKLDRLGANDVILAFGDSLTFGTGAGPTESYPAVLERNIGHKVVNAGVPGEASAEGLARLPEVLEEVRPKLLILCHGGNDFLRRLDESKASDNVRAMIKLARGKGIAVVLLATPKPGLPPYMPKFYGEIAAGERIPFRHGPSQCHGLRANRRGVAEGADESRRDLARLHSKSRHLSS